MSMYSSKATRVIGGILVVLVLAQMSYAMWHCVPTPRSVDRRSGVTTISLDRPIEVSRSADRQTAEYLAGELDRLFGTRPDLVTLDEPSTGSIWLGVSENASHSEGYRLDISGDGVVLLGDDQQGLFYAVQTLVGLLSSDKAVFSGAAVEVPDLVIRDWPDVHLRGVDMQWCYRAPSGQFMNDTARAMSQMKLNTLVVEFGRLLASDRRPDLFASGEGAVDRDTFRRFIQVAKEHRIQLVPKLNALAHGERGMPWPAPLGSGIDLGVEENYEALFDVVLEYQQAMRESGMDMPYFHFGMDEASACLLANEKKYDRPARELYAEHVARIHEFATANGFRVVIYHDQLIGKNETINWREMPTVHADRAGTWQARPELPRDIILNYWNYEGFPRYRTVEGLLEEGFEVWLTPWAGASVPNMAESAEVLGCGVIGSTWSNSGYGVTEPLDRRSLHVLRWLSDAIGNLAQYAWQAPVTGADGSRASFDATAWLANLYWDRPMRSGARRMSPVELPHDRVTNGRAYLQTIRRLFRLRPQLTLKGVPFNVSHPVALGSEYASDAEDQWVRILEHAAKPLRIIVEGKEAYTVDAVNRARGANELVLYTRAYGTRTNTNPYGGEATVIDGIVEYHDTWGVGNARIPRNGFVVSAHGEARYQLSKLEAGSKVTLVDGQGQVIEGPERSPSRSDSLSLSIGRSVQSLIFLHATSRETSLAGPPLVEVVVQYADGGKETFSFKHGRDLCAYDESLLLYERTEPRARWLAAYNLGRQKGVGACLYAYQWHSPEVERKVEKIDLTLTEHGRRTGYLLLGLTVEEPQ